MRQDQAAEVRDFKRKMIFLGRHVGPAKKYQRNRFAKPVFPMAFNGGDLGGLVFEGIDTMNVADHRLQRRHQQQHPHRHRRHLANGRIVVAAQQVPGPRCAHQQRGRQESRNAHVRQTVGKGRVENDGEPVGRNDPAVNNCVAGWRLHPAVGRQNPGHRHQRSQRHHHGRDEVQPRPDPLPAKQHDAQESGFEKERGQYLISQQRPRDAAGKVGKKAPVGAELVSHDQPRHHPHAEIDGKNLRPEMVQIAENFLAGA